jgi:hypothetical protein
VSQAEKIKTSDLVLGNGVFELSKRSSVIYSNTFSILFAAKKLPYFIVRDFIVSPGQCMIRKNCIPQYWINNIMITNGADDYFLWLLMFDQGAKVSINSSLVYTHKYTGENYSMSMKKISQSINEMIRYLEVDLDFNKKRLNLLIRTLNYKQNLAKGKWLFFKASFRNIDLFFYNVLYRLLWRGCHIKEGDY